MIYEAESDIGDGYFNCAELSSQMKVVTNRIRFAIESKNELDSEFRQTFPFLLQSFVTTHDSILAVIRFGNNEKYERPNEDIKTNMLHGSDAMSLVREQVEKVFTVALLCHEPEKWIREYLRDDWKRVYERELHQKATTGRLERFQHFHNEEAPFFIEGLRKTSYVTEEEKTVVELQYRDEPIPDKLKDHKIKMFPTPSLVIDRLKGTTSEAFLRMLYKEYRYICGYTHVGPTKLQLLMISDRKLGKGISSHDKELYYRTAIEEPAIITSITAALAACTEVLRFVPHDVDILEILISQWEILRNGSFLAKSLWDLRAESMFPRLIG